MSQWGTITLANRGLSPLEILRFYYPRDLELVTANNIDGIAASYPGFAIRLGSTGEPVRRMQNMLNRIRVNFPAIARIENPNGIFEAQTDAAVRAFQRIFDLTQDGIIGPATWNRINFIFVAVTDLAELTSEGIRATIGERPPNVVLRQGSRGEDVLQLQFILNIVSRFYPEISPVIEDGVFDARTLNSVREFQKRFGLTVDGVAGPMTWNRLYEVYRGIDRNVSMPYPPKLPAWVRPPYPETLLRNGSRGENVRLMQSYITAISGYYQTIPPLTADGIFGPLTETSVRAFQREFNLVPDGIIGPITWNKILDVYETLSDGTSVPPVLPPPALPPPPPPPEDYFFYTVVPGDSLWSIGQRFGTTAQAIMQLNGLSGDLIFPGQMLKIPGSVPLDGTPPPITPPTLPPVFDRPYPGIFLRNGSRGDDVRFMQQMLADLRALNPNLPQIAADGIFGPRTEEAVRAFQNWQGLAADGIIGPITWRAVLDQRNLLV